MDRDDVRREIEDADDTGMIADEQQIVQAETLGPLLRPALPHADLHAALPQEHEAHSTIDALHAEIGSESPNKERIEQHVNALRGIPELEAIIANFWDSPKTQRFIAILGQI